MARRQVVHYGLTKLNGYPRSSGMKILVIKRDKLGDMLLATPMLAHLRACLPDAEIHLLANDYNAWVVDGNSDIDHRWVYRRVRHAGRVSLFAVLLHLIQDLSLRRM